MQELIFIVGIIGGILANLAMILGLLLSYSHGNYGYAIGGLVFLAGSMIIWSLPSVYYFTYARKIEPGNKEMHKFCKWINGIFLSFGGLIILQVAIQKL